LIPPGFQYIARSATTGMSDLTTVETWLTELTTLLALTVKRLPEAKVRSGFYPV